MNTDMPSLNIGDKVKIKSYRVNSMRCQGQTEESWRTGITGWITGYTKSETWKSTQDAARIIVMPSDKYGTEQTYTEKLENLELIEKGKGRAPLIGIDTPLPEYYERATVIEEWIYKLKRVNQKHQGFKNAATFLAWLYINNDSRALDAAHRERRKDGTINPARIEKLFRSHRLTVDSWALELPLEVPAEITNYNKIAQFKPRVDWQEVADAFRAE